MSYGAIDLGTWNTKEGVLDSLGTAKVIANELGETVLRSVVYFEDDGNILVGTDAENAGLADPSRYVANWKRSMGADEVLYEDPRGKKWLAKDIAALLLGKCKETYERRTGGLLARVSLSVPANYTDRQKQETKDAAQSVGLKVVGLFHEPSAGAYGCKVYERGDGLVLVLDLGGGTFDVSLVRKEGNTVMVMASNGVKKLGGVDYHERLFERGLEEFQSKFGFKPTVKTHPVVLQDYHHRVEQAKATLSARPEAKLTLVCDGKVLSLNVTREEFAKLTQELTKQAMDCAEATLKEAGVSPKEVREVLAIGGASLMPSFREAIAERFAKKPSEFSEPHLAVVLGAAVMGRIQLEREGSGVPSEDGRMLPRSGLYAEEITQHPIGVAVQRKDGRLVNSVIFPKGQPMPSTRTEPFQLAEPGQTCAHIRILQGPDGAPLEECEELGHFDLLDLPAIHDRAHQIDITGRIDKNGMLTATARCAVSGKSKEMVLNYKKNSEKGETV